ncbi:MAG: hypothetical protein LBL73_05635 [Synergistaceae bacterium]|nr:hypothetical protein [Synergistaceae bacterium]
MSIKHRSKLLSVLLSATMLTQCFFPCAASAGQLAEEAAEIAMWIAIIEGAEYALLAASFATLEAEAETVATEAKGLALEKARNKRVEENYEHDHEALEDVVWESRTDSMSRMIDVLSRSGALSFAADLSREKFDAQNPGQLETPSGAAIDFASDFKKRADDWQSYAYGALAANNDDLKLVLDAQSGEIHELQEASYETEYYRQILQAENQTINYTNQELAEARLSIARQIELRKRVALLARQEKTDEKSAFTQAVNNWKAQSAGGRY